MRDPSNHLDDEAPGTTAAVEPGWSDLVAALPFGIGISTADGFPICANAGYAVLAQSVGNAALVAKSLGFQTHGQSYVANLLFEDAEQAGREQALIRRAYFDELTGLPNRRLIEQSVGAVIDSGEGAFALAFIDVDGFKSVNDFYGHNIGDGLLVQIAERLGSILRPSDMLARLSGDEFMLLISPAANDDALHHAVNSIAERLRQPFYVDGNEIFSSASIGVSLYPQDGASYDTLRANADRAMYRGKSAGTSTVQFFDSSIEHAAIEKSRLEQRLRLAIRDRRVSCAYQPKVDVHEGRIYGIEVLLRWMDEDGAIQPPGEFIALAIELGLMDELTYLILDKTVASIDRINDAFGEGASISLNVAARQAGDIRFMRALLDRISETGFARRFILEITEEAFVSKSTFQQSVLPMIRDIGARVSIDDFGVGYSSLAALADITADEVKIDRSFITDLHQRPRSQNILKAVEALSRSLGMEVIVEGLETFEELAYLKACTTIRYAQGYYFSRPVMLEELGVMRDESVRQAPVSRPQALNRSFVGRNG
ncbi:putative bifunctional diguanylate cyclase/phosphodiesterase [Rhizobium sp.]